MVVSDTTILIGIGLLFIYLVVYQKNKLFGNLSYIGISSAIMYYGTGTTEKAIGFVMFFGSAVNLVYDFLVTKNK